MTISDAVAGSPQTVSLTGTGTNPTVSLSPNSLPFGNQNLGTTSAAQSVTLTNTGNTSLNIASIAVIGANPGDFATSNTCGSIVAPTGKCTISVTFTPASAGSRAASVAISDNATGSPQSIALAGTGVGTAPVAGLSTNSLTFGSQTLSTTSSPLTVTLTNTGNATLNIASPAFAGANPADFTLSANTCGGSLAASSSCLLSVTFSHLAGAGAATAHLL